jgi:osmoprotectant transport system ATP-binding protein
VLDGVTLALARGEIVALLGRSGGGKSTLLQLASALLRPDAGEVRFEGRPTGAWDPFQLRRRLGFMLQEGGLFPHFTVARNIALVPSLEGWPQARQRERVRALMALVGLPLELEERLPAQLSGGQRQRVGVARALAADPPVLLCDEPFGALDPLTRAALQREFVGLQRRLGKSALFVTHDLREALIVADRIALLDQGRLAVLAPPQGFLASAHPLAVAFQDSLAVPLAEPR